MENSPSCYKDTCPLDTLKLGACVDLLGGLVHIGLGDPVWSTSAARCVKGSLKLEAAVCLCTTLKIKLLNLNIFVPLALQLLLTCGRDPPPVKHHGFLPFHLTSVTGTIKLRRASSVAAPSSSLPPSPSSSPMPTTPIAAGTLSSVL
ncbi:hypothetical protein HHK36_032540 [Tetracentron sinense]|uniref:Hydrophobic seed protein domain-containing protein n=1 Tax=Tetracentron sinense TaxID=13715 RepID=A0A834Y7Y5_TETSI|nr:hypothetical protein HHK36_032540 [Tetracentron sinense]